jgi:hypothetical protein
MKATFRVSEVESFRQWRDDEDADLELLLTRLRGQSEPSEVMRAGTAFHAALETAQEGSTEVLTAMGYLFPIRMNAELALPAIRELRASKTYELPDCTITVSGQLDALDGKRIEDHKTTGRFDPERYLSGFQWRLYLEIFGADHFRWNVFEIAATDDPLMWDVKDFHVLEQYRYPAMGADCKSLVADLAEFAKAHLPERFTPVQPG